MLHMLESSKQLLLQDLCARLPYDIMCEVFDPEEDFFNARLIQIDAWTSHCYFWGCSETDPYKIEQVKPYLRPLSSMTEEEVEEFVKLQEDVFKYGEHQHVGVLTIAAQDWLNRKMFDYRGLIPMGLALEAPKDMYKYKRGSIIRHKNKNE